MPEPDEHSTTDAPATDSIEAFAIDLRALRSARGEPTLMALGAATGVSKSVIADAFAGKRLPTERTVRALLLHFGEEPRPWLVRRTALATPATPDAPVPPTAPRLVTLRTTILVAAATAVVVAAVSVGVMLAVVPGGSASAAPSIEARAPISKQASPALAVTGDDPAATTCVDDAIVAASTTRAHDTKIELIYSAVCNAAWGRITRYDDQSSGQSVSARIYEKAHPNAPSAQSTTEPDAQSAYTTLIARSSTEDHLCVTASITVKGADVDLGDPICI